MGELLLWVQAEAYAVLAAAALGYPEEDEYGVQLVRDAVGSVLTACALEEGGGWTAEGAGLGGSAGSGSC